MLVVCAITCLWFVHVLVLVLALMLVRFFNGCWGCPCRGGAVRCVAPLQVVSADASGKILTWDTRTGGIVDSYSLEDPIHISHIQASPPDAGRQDEEGLLLAANCFDNTLRVFHRRFLNNSRPPHQHPLPRRSKTTGGSGGGGGNGGSSHHSTTGGGYGAGAGAAANAASSGMSSTSSQSSDAGKASSSSPGGGGAGEDGEDREPSLELMHALRGHTVKNWPIRCVREV